MSNDITYDDYLQDDHSGVTPIVRNNPMEEAASRYWRASRIWRDHEPSNWTFGDMIQELADLRRFRGLVPHLAQSLLDSVIRSDSTIPQLEAAASNDAQGA